MIRLVQKKLIIPRGDTGSFSVPLSPHLTTGDVAVFTIIDARTRTKIWDKEIELVGETLEVRLEHEDTVNLPVGKFFWDIKFYSHPERADGILFDGDEVDSYFAAYGLPECEIRLTGDNLLTSTDSPTTTLTAESINLLSTTVTEVTNLKEAAEQSAEAAADSAQTASDRVNEIQVLNPTATTLNPTDDVTVSYDSTTGELAFGIPRGATPDFTIGTVTEGPNADASITGTLLNPILNLTLPNANVELKADKLNTVLENSLSMGRKANTTVGTNSVALGYNTTASGYGSIAMSNSAKATSSYSTAIGSGTQATGAMSTAIGNQAQATATNSVAIGYGAKATAERSIAMGHEVTSNGTDLLVLGKYNKAATDYIPTAPLWDINHEYVLGDKVTYNNKEYECVNPYAIEETFNSDGKWWPVSPSTQQAIIVGNGDSENPNSKSNAFSLDWNGTGHFMGDIYVKANKDSTGGNKVAVLNDIPSVPSWALEPNKPTYTAAEIGALPDDTTIPDISVKADKLDTVIQNSLSMGRKDDTTVGTNSVALGYNTTASGYGSVAMIHMAKATGSYAISLGSGTQATGITSTAIGNQAQATQDNSVAIGYKAKTTAERGVAIGTGTTANGTDLIALGKYNKLGTNYIPTAPQWEANHTYVRGDIVTYDGKEYECYDSQANEKTFGASALWKVISPSSQQVVVIGNGVDDSLFNRSNAFALDWDGTGHFAGDVYVGANSDGTGGNKVATVSQVNAKLDSTLKGVANGLAELDANGHVPSSQLPSYVDDVLEFNNTSGFPQTGEAGKIYVAKDLNLTFRWSGSTYVEISPSLALGETSSTAYRGDRGKIAYTHAQEKGNEYAEGLYKITTNAHGHVTSATAVQKADITALGIPAQDTTYENKVAANGGLDISLVTTGEKYTWNNKYEKPVNGIPAADIASGVIPTVYDWAKAATKPAYTAAEVGALSDNEKLITIPSGTDTQGLTLVSTGDGYAEWSLQDTPIDYITKTIVAEESILDAADNAPLAITFTLPLKQEGENDPSPTNIRKFIPYTGITIMSENYVTEHSDSARIDLDFDKPFYGGKVEIHKDGEVILTPYYVVSDFSNTYNTSTSNGYTLYIGTFNGWYSNSHNEGFTIRNSLASFTTVKDLQQSIYYNYSGNVIYAKVPDTLDNLEDLQIAFEGIHRVVQTLNTTADNILHTYTDETGIYINAEYADYDSYTPSTIEITYALSPKKYTDVQVANLINATIEDNHADRNYSIGEIIKIEDKYYRITGAVSEHYEFIPGTNCEEISVAQIIGQKANKPSSSTSGNFAALDSNGDLTDSGHKHSDYVTDIQINSTSILDNGVANIPIANSSSPGVAKTSASLGISITNGTLHTYRASSTQTKNGVNEYAPITPAVQHEATFYGLAKAAGDSTQSASDNAVGTYTEDAKSAIRSMIGAGTYSKPASGIPATDLASGVIPDVPVQDVQIDGTSILSNGIANIPVATSSIGGVIKSGEGLAMDSNGKLNTNKATDVQVKAGIASYRPITPAIQHTAAFYGLAKAAGADMASSNNEVGVYTDSAKSAICNMIGASDIVKTQDSQPTTPTTQIWLPETAPDPVQVPTQSEFEAALADKLDKSAIDNTGITAKSYTTKFGGEFSVTTATTTGYIKPFARASVTGGFDKTKLHRVTFNGTAYTLRTRLWYHAENGNIKVYTYVGNIGKYISDTSGVPGGIDDVPFVIISDLNNSSSIDVLTETAGTYTILVEQINYTQTSLPKSLIWDDNYVPIEKNNNSGTYNGVSIGVNELTNKRGTIAIGYGNKITKEFSTAIGVANTVNIKDSLVEGSGNTVTGANGHSAHIEGYLNTVGDGIANHVEGMNNNISAMVSNIHVEGASNTISSTDGLMSHIEGINNTTSEGTTHVEGSSNICNSQYEHVQGIFCSPSARYPDWVANTAYSIGDCVYYGSGSPYKAFRCIEANSDASFTQSKWEQLPSRGNSAFTIGNGLSTSERSNALRVDWDGNIHAKGDIYVGANADSTGGTKLARVSDIQVNGTSILNNGIANIPIAATDTLGAVKPDNTTIQVDNTGVLAVKGAEAVYVRFAASTIRPLTPSTIDTAAFYGLAKAAGVDEKENATLGTYTTEAKAAIQTMLGVENGVSFVETVVGTTPTITGMPNTRYKCGEVSTISITPPTDGTIDVTFTSGSSVAILTVPNTVKFPAWFDPTVLETNTTYEILITDGIYGSVMLWSL